VAARSKFTREVRDAIIGALEQGVPRKHAAESAGVSEQTFYGWLRRAGDPGLDADGEYERFAERVMVAVAGGASTWFDLAKEQAEGAVCEACGKRGGDAGMTKFLLERLYPETYGASITIKVRQALDGELELVMDRIHRSFGHDPELLTRILAAVAGESEDSEGDALH
jgi:transposase-like protein